MKKTHTSEEKKEYFNSLRQRWATNKALAESDTTARAKYEAILAETPNYKISYANFYFISQEMKRQKMDGLPYVDAKTFKGWNEAGYMVKKGQHSTLEGITWLEVKSEDADSFLVPKAYKLFHRKQVEAITL